MAWTGLVLTVDGQNALNNAQISDKLNIKSIVIGDGNTPTNFRTMKRLVNQLYEITELKVDAADGRCTITADFPSVDYDYYFREIGVIAATDEGDKLYVYDNCGDDAQYIVTTTGVEKTRKRIRMNLKISDVAEITAVTPEILYVAYDDFENRLANKVNIVVMESDIPAAEKKKDTWYLKITSVQSYRSMRAGPGLAARIIGEEDEVWQAR